MSRIGFAVVLSTISEDAKGAFDDDGAELVFHEVCEVIQQFLKEQLESDVALEYLEELDEVIETNCEETNRPELDFQFVDHWYLGAELAYHWYELALQSPICQGAINEHLAEYDLTLAPLKNELYVLLGPQENSVLFVELQGEIVGIDTQEECGELVLTEGVDIELSDEESQYVEEIRATKLCHCPLCLSWREELHKGS